MIQCKACVTNLLKSILVEDGQLTGDETNITVELQQHEKFELFVVVMLTVQEKKDSAGNAITFRFVMPTVCYDEINDDTTINNIVWKLFHQILNIYIVSTTGIGLMTLDSI